MDKSALARSITLLWTPLTDAQRQAFEAAVEQRTYNRREDIFRTGDTPTHIYYLLKGKVTLWRTGVGQQAQIVQMVEPGVLFGLAPAFNNQQHQSTATPSAGSVVAMVPIELIFHFVWENSSFALVFIRELSNMLGLSETRTMQLTQKHIRGRLAETLLLMHQKFGVEADGQTLAVYLSRQDLGQMSNMTTSNAIRTLTIFAEEGVLAIEGRKIRFLDLARLQRISDLG